MWWILQNIARFLYYSILDFVFFIIVDAFAKFTIGDTNSKSMQEKRQIWFWESVVLIVLSIIIYLCDHFPFLLILLSLVTLGYTQFGVSFNLFRWWTQMKARWEEHQQHQDSMSRLQVQLDMQRKQQQQHGNPAFHHGMAFNQYPQQQIPKQNIFNATPVNKPKTNNQSERGMYMSGWAKTTQQRFSNMMKRFQGEKNEEKKGTSDSPPLKKTEFSFMPSLQAKSSFGGGQHFAHGLMNDSYAESVQRLSDLEWMSYKQENTSVVDNLFTGQLVIAYHCLADNHISVNMQTFRLLPVPIEAPREVNGLVHLSDCFTKFCNIEHLVGQDGLECSFCNAQRARQQEPPQTPLTTPYLRKHYNLRTPSVNGRTLLSSADSAVSGVGSPLATNFMSPIPGSRDMLSDSGFQDNVFKTSTPISDNQIPFPQRLRDAQRRCSLRQLPDCFVIQLMRFSYNPYTRQTNKVHSPVSIPLSNLDLTEVMFDTITNREDLAEEDAVYKYDLYGLCCHLGGDSANYGHYISYCLHGDNKWYRFDDERVIEVDMEYELTTHEIRQNAYLLFYKKQGMSV